jgi:uncharacterized protein
MFFPRATGILLCFLLLAFGAGCFPKKTLPPDIPAPPADTSQSLLRRAELAWQARNYSESARLYEQLAWEPREGVDSSALHMIRNRLVQSLLQIQRFNQAVQALKLWDERDPMVHAWWFWHDYLVRAWLGLSREMEAAEHLTQLMRQPEASWEMRYTAGVRLFELRRQTKMYAAMAEVLSALFAMAPDDKTRAELERMAMHTAKKLSGEELQALVSDLAQEEQWVFPYSVFLWEQQRRVASHDATAWPDARAMLKRLLQRGDWVDSGPLSSELSELEKSFDLPGICLGLVLPLDGPLKETGWKVLRGAEAGRSNLLFEGIEIRLEIINALSSNLVEKIRDMDAACALVGGPIQGDVWKRIHDAGLDQDRYFFTFLPSLADLQEGRDAWRFFSAPQDQVRSLAELTVHSLGIASSGVLYPEDRFGRYMTELFTREMANQGGIVRKTQGYMPGEHSDWGATVAALLGIRAQERRGRAESVELPEPGFQALFIPDSLPQAEMLLPQLFYYDEQRLLILGPELWSQAWSRRMDQIESQYFRLAVMPGAWWPGNPASPARALNRIAEEHDTVADFWMALGYDFVRWGATLALPATGRDSNAMNAILAQQGDFEWSMAPLDWDAAGVARQDLYLFWPTATGLGIVDPEALRFRLERVRALHHR